MVQILLIHNELSGKPLTWLSLGIRIITCSKWNHVAIRIDDEVYEAVGEGVIKTPYSEWLIKANRIVLPLEPKKKTKLNIREVKDTLSTGYGFLDLWDRFNQIREERWFGKEHIHKEYEGLICSDLACILLGILKELMPCDIYNQHYQLGLIKKEEYTTTKNRK